MTLDRVDHAAPVVVIGGGQAGFSAAVKLRDLADRIAALTPRVPQTDSTELVRDHRER